ncbi:MAG TPA: hypothetical protein DCE44_13340, partial [Verrucomicrobiales bacterium]|nr:hypothetical protein [Verrucomicrobiales bacterium]
YANVGNASMPAPLIQVRSTDPEDNEKPILTLSPTRLVDGFNTSVLPEGFGHSVTILASGRQLGFLHPGERVQVPVYFAGILEPRDFHDTNFEFGLSVIESSDQRTMNWVGATYIRGLKSYKVCPLPECREDTKTFDLAMPWRNGDPPTAGEVSQFVVDSFSPGDTAAGLTGQWDEPGVLQLRPDSINEVAWSAIVSNLRERVGEKLGDWVQILSENAQYLARHGKPNSNIDDLWRFEVLKASGLGPVPVLDSVTDASMVTPGVGLSVSRAFPNTIPGRHVQGPFGYGWTFSWDQRLMQGTNGLVEIGGCCGGARRRYEPDIRTVGKYFSMPGDASTLYQDSNGRFILRSSEGTLTRFNIAGRSEAIEDPNGNRVTAFYDSQGRLERLDHSSGSSLFLAYNAAGRIASIHDSAGRTNRFSYDASGNYLQTVTTDDGKVTRYTYQTTGDPRVLHALTSIERGGTTQHFEFDERGRLQSTYRADGEQRVRFAYDPAGTVFVSDQLGTNSLYYNESGLLTKVVDPLEHITSSVFDAEFRLKKLILPTGEQQSFDWTKQGNLTRLTDELGQTTSFSYRPEFNRLASFTDAKLNTTRYTYDTRGNLVSTIYPNQSVERFANYTEAGLPLSYTNRRSQPLTYEYNAAGQITNQIFADGHAIQFTYDPRGNLASTVDGDKVTTYAYAPDTDGDRLKRVTYPQGRFLDYTYDAFGRRIQMTDQDGFASKYEYDSAGRLWKLRDETDTLLVTYTYEPSGRVSRIDKGNGTFTTYEYDPAGQLLSLKNHRNATTLNSRFDYTYDRRGRRRTMSTLDGDWTYGYDATGQLTRAVFDSINPEIPDQDLTYEYDALGNRVRTIENGVTNLYVANNLNQYTSVGGTNHLHDADGNLTFDGVNTYEWDQQSRLVRVTGPSGVTEYEYDAFGNRAGTVLNGRRIGYVLDPTGAGDVLVEYGDTEPELFRNIYGNGLIGRSQAGSPIGFYDFDGIGSVHGITTNAGALFNNYAFSPFGESLYRETSLANPFEFIGQFGVQDGESQLCYMRSRFYSTAIGRFLSIDPIRIDGGDQNFYRYVKNDSPGAIDPMGLYFLRGFPRNTGKVIRGSFKVWGNKISPFWEAAEAFDVILNTDVNNHESCVNGFKTLGSLSAGFGVGLATGSINPVAGFFLGQLASTAGALGGAAAGNFLCPPASPTQIPTPGLPPNDETETQSVSSTDPNEKRGPSGFGAANFLTAGASFPYRIRFENFGPGSTNANGEPFPPEVWASAPAQEVEITDQLSTNLNWASFRFTSAGFGDTILVPEQSAPSFERILPVTIQDKTFDVHFEISLNRVTGLVRTVFRSIDPQTSLPPEVLTGFLPPEDGTGIGQGFIEYLIEPRADLPTGAEIRNIGLISFDRQPIISTDQIDPLDASRGFDPQKQALVTIDADAPSSAVLPLPAITREPVFEVKWSGTDLGAGIADFDVYVSTNGGPWSLWIAATATNSAGFLGENGNTYAFYTLARDHVGFVEPPPATADASTTVILPLPLVVSVELIEGSPAEGLSIRLSYPVEPDFDYFVEFRDLLGGEDEWQSVAENPHNTSAVTIPTSEEFRFFRVQRVQR